MFTLPKLPYAYDALESYIDAETMHIHHDKHHQAYIDKLNAAVEKNPTLAEKTVEQLLVHPQNLDTAVRSIVINNGGGHSNHSFFWNCMSPNSFFDQSSVIGQAIKTRFGSIDALKEQFAAAGLARFGSGWVWLVVDHNTLEIIDTQNQDSPISIGKKPVLALDVWEHAYYLKYRNKRAEYIASWWNVVNWEWVEAQYIGAGAQK